MFHVFKIGKQDFNNFAESNHLNSKKFELLKGGLINAVYKIEIGGIPKVLRVYVRKKPKNDIEFELRAMEYFRLIGLPVPAVYQQNGKKIFRIKGKNAVIIDYLPGKAVDGKINSSQIKAIARCIGLFHYWGGKYIDSQKRIETDLFDFSYDNRFDQKYFKKITKENGFSNPEELTSFIQRETKLVFSKLKLVSHKSDVLIHNDAKLTNFLFEGNSITGIIDFDECCFADPDSDLATLIGVIPKRYRKIFVKQYESFSKRKVDISKVMLLAVHYRLLLLKWTISQFLKSKKSKDTATFRGYLRNYVQFNQLSNDFPFLRIESFRF